MNLAFSTNNVKWNIFKLNVEINGAYVVSTWHPFGWKMAQLNAKVNELHQFSIFTHWQCWTMRNIIYLKQYTKTPVRWYMSLTFHNKQIKQIIKEKKKNDNLNTITTYVCIDTWYMLIFDENIYVLFVNVHMCVYRFMCLSL